MFEFYIFLVEKQKQAKDYSVNSFQTNAEVNQEIYRGIIAICFWYIAIYLNMLLVYRDSPKEDGPELLTWVSQHLKNLT